jgi:hypothetical protein
MKRCCYLVHALLAMAQAATYVNPARSAVILRSSSAEAAISGPPSEGTGRRPGERDGEGNRLRRGFRESRAHLLHRTPAPAALPPVSGAPAADLSVPVLPAHRIAAAAVWANMLLEPHAPRFPEVDNRRLRSFALHSFASAPVGTF